MKNKPILFNYAVLPTFYDVLEQFLDHSHKGVISCALDNEYLNPNHDNECFDVNVLKTLLSKKANTSDNVKQLEENELEIFFRMDRREYRRRVV